MSASAQRQGFGAALSTVADRALAAGQPMLPAGQVGAASKVPWKLVGPGWDLVQYTTGNYTTPKAVTLYMVDPAGGKYRMYQSNASKTTWQLVDWSGDKARALLAQPGTRDLRQLVLATGHLTSFRLPSASDVVLGYTRPDGTSILVQTSNGIARYSLTGVLQKRLVTGKQYKSALASANGTFEVVNGPRIVVVSNAGGIIRRLAAVPGTSAAAGGCTPLRWWNSTTVLASCMTSASAAGPLWLVPASGAAAKALTPARTGQGPDYGDLDAWQLPSGLYLQATGACSYMFIGKQAASGTVTAVSVPGSTGSNVVVAASGRTMLVQEINSCNPGSSLVWFNPATRAVQKVLMAPKGALGVLSTAAYDRNGQQPARLG